MCSNARTSVLEMSLVFPCSLQTVERELRYADQDIHRMIHPKIMSSMSYVVTILESPTTDPPSFKPGGISGNRGRR